MQCYNHSEQPAIGTCSNCGKAVCNQCAVSVDEKIVCRLCLATGKGTRNNVDVNNAFIFELICGLFGFLGVGHLIAGRTNDGLIRIIGFLVYNIVAWVTISLLSMVVIGVVCIPIQIIIQIGIPIWSALKLKKELLA